LHLGLPFFFFLLFIPIIPFLGRERELKRCPLCGWETGSPRVEFCPYDGTPLTVASEDGSG